MADCFLSCLLFLVLAECFDGLTWLRCALPDRAAVARDFLPDAAWVLDFLLWRLAVVRFLLLCLIFALGWLVVRCCARGCLAAVAFLAGRACGVSPGKGASCAMTGCTIRQAANKAAVSCLKSIGNRRYR